MTVYKSAIQEIHLQAGSYQLTIEPIRLRLNPGQYCTAYGENDGEFLAQTLFPIHEDQYRYGLRGRVPNSWAPGMQLHLAGPYGHGFNLITATQRVAVVQLTDNPYQMISLLEMALEQGAAVVYCADVLFPGLPSLVEVLPLDSIAEVMQWADYIAIEVADHQLTGLPTLLGSKPREILTPKIEILINAPILCSGKGDCGVCSVSTRKGWMRACKDGPVFNYNQLEL